MKILLILLFHLLFNSIYCQNFLNGDLDGDIDGFSSLPFNWINVPHTDNTCQANQYQGATPNVTSETLPDTILGVAGIPHSGETFLSGTHGDTYSGIFFQEGIMQNLTGFVSGKEYRIEFFQTVLKGRNAIDTSGSWAVYLDNELLEITIPSKSYLQYDDRNVQWDKREIDFIAQKQEYLIKFLPFDDDSTLICDSMYLDGCLYMGIDSINLLSLSPVQNIEVNNNNSVEIYPIPASNFINIHFKGENKIDQIQLFSSEGKLLISLNSINKNKLKMNLYYPKGIYFVKIIVNHRIFLKKFLIGL